jgi:hypothetical protein
MSAMTAPATRRSTEVTDAMAASRIRELGQGVSGSWFPG